jgi:hypothetical protein
MMREAGYVIDHEHNHAGQCWWEMRAATSTGEPSKLGEVAGEKDVRLRPEWKANESTLDRYHRANDPDQKIGGV